MQSRSCSPNECCEQNQSSHNEQRSAKFGFIITCMLTPQPQPAEDDWNNNRRRKEATEDDTADAPPGKGTHDAGVRSSAQCAKGENGKQARGVESHRDIRGD